MLHLTDDPLQQFMKIIKEYKLWKTFEIKSCLFRESETCQWKAGFVYIQLREDAPYTATGINTSRLKLIHEVKDIKYLNGFLNVGSSSDGSSVRRLIDYA